MSYASVIFDGRLGNNLHQLACLMSYCKKYSKTPLIHEWKYLKYFKNLPEPTAEIPKFGSAYNEPHFHHSEIPFFHENIELTGYFQSNLYHEGIDVNHLFELKDEYKNKVDDLYDEIVFNKILDQERFCNIDEVLTCSIHVRRSDYLNPGTKEYHGVLPIEYYEDAAISLYGTRFSGEPKVVFLVFSDDIEWCKKEFINPNIYFVEGNEDVIDLFLMAKCNDNIIANSSFSWWGSYLNKNPNKKVVAPKNWFAAAPQNNTRDLYFPNTIII